MRGFFAGSTIAQSTAPVSTIPQCGSCGLYKHCQSPKIKVGGQGRRKVLIVTAQPGKSDDEENAYFSGSEGHNLRTTLNSLGVDLDKDCWHTAALICHTKGKPTNEQITYCQPNLTKAIKDLQPEIIIPLGAEAVKGVLGPIWRGDIKEVERWVGWRVPVREYNCWVCPAYHYNDLGRIKEEVVHLWQGRYLAAAFELEGRPYKGEPPDYKKMIEVVLDCDKAARIIYQMVERGGMVAFDYETNMLKPDGPDARIISCSVCWQGRRTIAYPWHGAAIGATQALLRSNLPKVASNLKFEERWTLKEFGHPVRNWKFDTMLGAHVVDNRHGITSIKFQSFVHLGFPAYNLHIEPFLKTKGDNKVNQILKEIAIDDLLLYNGLDSLLEYLVAVKQMDELGIPHE